MRERLNRAHTSIPLIRPPKEEGPIKGIHSWICTYCKSNLNQNYADAADIALTRFAKRDTLRDAVFLWSKPLLAARTIFG